MKTTLSKRYSSYLIKAQTQELNHLVLKLQQQASLSRRSKEKSVQADRQTHRSCVEIKRGLASERSHFNNKTKEGQYFDSRPPQNPYLFIPKYKNETFIMPDRVFEKGKAGKRFLIKMKDTSVYSFQEKEKERYRKVIHKEEKDKVIMGRKIEQLSRILDSQNGREKSKKIKLHLRNRKIFNPPSSPIEIFDNTQPMLSPRDSQSLLTKKISLGKAFDYSQWKPVSTTNTFFTPTSSIVKASQTQALSFR